MTKFVPATDKDIIDLNKFNIEHGYKVSFRHGIMEMGRVNSKNGVAHRDHSRSKLYIVDGIPHVKRKGQLVKVTATVAIIDDTHRCIYDLREAWLNG